jgi:hypothetical protein
VAPQADKKQTTVSRTPTSLLKGKKIPFSIQQLTSRASMMVSFILLIDSRFTPSIISQESPQERLEKNRAS